MAVSDITTTTTTDNAEKSSAKEAIKNKEKKERPPTKIVVRRLPPGMDQDSFNLQVSPIPEHDYLYMVKGDMSLGENAFSRAYINFAKVFDVYDFKQRFDNYVFVDQKGNEYPAVVEFASFQKIPRKRKARSDPKLGSVESDPVYLEFLESLKEQPNQEEKPEFSYQFSDNKDDIISTPLLDYIKQKRIDKQRIREERRDERRRKELERKKLREDERKRQESKTAVVKGSVNSRSTKPAALQSVKEETTGKMEKNEGEGDKDEVVLERTKNKETKFEDTGSSKKSFGKPKPRFSSRNDKDNFAEKKGDYKRRDDFREKEYRNRRFEEYNKKEVEVKEAPRKTKKYSEKREERRNEARKAEQKKMDESLETNATNINNEEVPNPVEKDLPTKSEESLKPQKVEENEKARISETESKVDDSTASQVSIDEDTKGARNGAEPRHRHKDHDTRPQRRIRNKDRPTMAIYQPGMLSKRKSVDGPDLDNPTTSKE